MIVGEEGHFRLLISSKFLHLTSDAIRPIGGGTLERQSITLFHYMRATLSGGSDFNVVARQDDQDYQLIPSVGYAQWDWDVTPQHYGELLLTLHIFAPSESHVANNDLIKDVNIRVRADALGELKVTISQHWEWLWTAVIVPIGLLLRREWVKRHATGRTNP